MDIKNQGQLVPVYFEEVMFTSQWHKKKEKKRNGKIPKERLKYSIWKMKYIKDKLVVPPCFIWDKMNPIINLFSHLFIVIYSLKSLNLATPQHNICWID